MAGERALGEVACVVIGGVDVFDHQFYRSCVSKDQIDAVVCPFLVLFSLLVIGDSKNGTHLEGVGFESFGEELRDSTKDDFVSFECGSIRTDEEDV